MIIDFEDFFVTRSFNSNTSDHEKIFKKVDKDMILKVIERKNKDNINYLDIDIELSTKY